MLKLLKMARDNNGMAAVEFALMLPVLVLLFFGTYEVSNALICRQDVTDVAAAASDLVAQEKTATIADIDNVFAALDSMLYPYPSAQAQIVISSIVDNGTTNSGTVAWSMAHNGATARTVGSIVTVPTGLITTGGSVILAEVTYNYTSATTVVLPSGALTITSNFYSKPRRIAQIPTPS